MKLLGRHPIGSTLVCALALVAAQRPSPAAEVELYAGAPFGVGRVTLGVNSAGPALPVEDERFTAASADGRVLYPVVEERQARRLIRRLLEIDTPLRATVYFLFRGNEPLDLQAYSPQLERIRVTPVNNPAQHERLLRQWWNAYSSRWASLRQDPQFPPVVENFLAANLARRLGQTLPETSSGLFQAMFEKSSVWDDLLLTESYQLSVDQALLAGGAADEGALGPLPPQMPWYDLELDPASAAPAVEPIAEHVPAECFYVRFGNFTNYLWFRDLKKKWDGDLANMVIRRAIEPAIDLRIEQQLGLRQTAMAKIVGPQVIADVAMIGLDPYVKQGGAVGILFHAKASPLLAADLISQRHEAMKRHPDATESMVRIADRDVSLVASPRGEIRSYYAADGDFHLVATSPQLIQRFLQAGRGDRALAATPGFQQMRQQLPLDRDDSVFAYLSPEFMRELTSPAIWIESQRRIRSLREMKLIELARFQAAAEGINATTTPELIAAGLLPAGFGARRDGSELRAGPDGFIDAIRGPAGLFLPAADVEVPAATPAEVAAYNRFADRFRQEVGQTPPVAVAMRRVPTADGSGESMVADVLASPLEHVKLGRLPSMLGDASRERVGAVEGDIVRAEIVLGALLPFPLGESEPHHLFLAAHDFNAPLVARRGKLEPAMPPSESMKVYWGAWPRPGLMKVMLRDNLAEGPEPLAVNEGSWQARRDDFWLMSFRPELVRAVLPELHLEQVERPAQAWLNVEDPSGTKIAQMANSYGYMRSREASVAACRLMNTLANQLHVPRGECRAVAERLLDARFRCPLGGEYEVVEIVNGQSMWTSTALAPQNRFLFTDPPADFTLPALSWFQGLRADASLTADEISAHVEIDMAKSAVP